MRRESKILGLVFAGCLVLLTVSLLWILPSGSVAAAPSSEYFENTPDKINVNTAPVSELMCLEGIGEKRAQAIVDHREKYGNYSSAEDLKKVPGISNGILEKIQDAITFE